MTICHGCLYLFEKNIEAQLFFRGIEFERNGYGIVKSIECLDRSIMLRNMNKNKLIYFLKKFHKGVNFDFL